MSALVMAPVGGDIPTDTLKRLPMFANGAEQWGCGLRRELFDLQQVAEVY
jgi:hypothetical protein